MNIQMKIYELQHEELQELLLRNALCEHNQFTTAELLKAGAIVMIKQPCKTIADNRVCYLCNKCGLHTHRERS